MPRAPCSIEMSASELLLSSYKSWLAEVHGFEMISDTDQQQLLDYFVDAGRPLTSRPVDVLEGTSWVEYWSDIADDAGLTGKVSMNGWVRWIKSAQPLKPQGGEGSRDQTVVAVLQKNGITVTDTIRRALADGLETFEAGDEHAQSTCLNAICIMYMLESPGVEDEEWFSRQKTTAMDNSLAAKYGQSQLATIDITRLPSYEYRLRKTKRGLLEHALLEKTGYAWSKYRSEMLCMLNAKGLSQCANRWSTIQARLERMALHNQDLQRKFWFELYYSVWRGLGLPQDWCDFAYQTVNSQDPSVKARLQLEHVHTGSVDAAPAPLGNAAAAGSDTLQMQQLMLQMMPQMMSQMMQSPAGGVTPKKQLEITEISCDFCGSTQHEMSVCTHFQLAKKANKSSRDEKNHAAAVARRAASAAKKAAEEEERAATVP